MENYGGIFYGENVRCKLLVENVWWEIVVETFGENAIVDIIEPRAFKKYSIHWVLVQDLEALCICLCLCLCVFVFVFVFV